MFTKLNQSILMVFTLLLNSLTRSTYAEAGQVVFVPPLQPYECPYPCLPPPIATTSNCPPPSTPATSHAPPPPSKYNPPPPSGWFYFYPPPTGYYPPPEYVNNYVAPPPPNPIMPYFPFYYKVPPPPFGFSSASRMSPLRACWIFLVAQVLSWFCTMLL